MEGMAGLSILIFSLQSRFFPGTEDLLHFAHTMSKKNFIDARTGDTSTLAAKATIDTLQLSQNDEEL